MQDTITPGRISCHNWPPFQRASVCPACWTSSVVQLFWFPAFVLTSSLLWSSYLFPAVSGPASCESWSSLFLIPRLQHLGSTVYLPCHQATQHLWFPCSPASGHLRVISSSSAYFYFTSLCWPSCFFSSACLSAVCAHSGLVWTVLFLMSGVKEKCFLPIDFCYLWSEMLNNATEALRAAHFVSYSICISTSVTQHQQHDNQPCFVSEMKAFLSCCV